MVGNVVKNAVENNEKSATSKPKIEWQRKTYPLKLKLDIEQQERIDVFLEEYAKVTQFVINKATNELFPFFKRKAEPQKGKEYPIGICSLCNKQKTLKYEWKTPTGKIKKNCGCLNGHYSLRKIFLPSKNYRITKFDSEPEWDMRLAGKLYNGFPKLIQGGDQVKGEEYNRAVYDSCLQKAVETIKSQNALN